mgnify:CR=1 FL=1
MVWAWLIEQECRSISPESGNALGSPKLAIALIIGGFRP